MTVIISLTKGYTAIVDDCDKDLAEFKWFAMTRTAKNAHHTTYAARTSYEDGKGKTVLMHKIILERMLGHDLPTGYVTDHIDNKSPLDNRRSNLRVATQNQNMINCDKQRSSHMPYKGISNNGNKRKPWFVQIRVNGKREYYGTFPNPEAAHLMYCLASYAQWGVYANFGDESPFKPCLLEKQQSHLGAQS